MTISNNICKLNVSSLYEYVSNYRKITKIIVVWKIFRSRPYKYQIMISKFKLKLTIFFIFYITAKLTKWFNYSQIFKSKLFYKKIVQIFNFEIIHCFSCFLQMSSKLNSKFIHRQKNSVNFFYFQKKTTIEKSSTKCLGLNIWKTNFYHFTFRSECNIYSENMFIITES